MSLLWKTVSHGKKIATTLPNYELPKHLNVQPAGRKPPDKPGNIIEISTWKWGEYTNKQFEENASSIYEKIVYWKKNSFLPAG